jgi:hypothetical protein
METLNTVLNHLAEIKGKYDEKDIKKLDLSLTERVAKRLDEFSGTCDTCSQILDDLEANLKNILLNKQSLDKDTIYAFHKHQKIYISHLSREHKLVREGHYASTYLALGTSLGLVFGLTVFDNIGLGLPIGLAVGLAIGSGMDADAKKQGKVI